MGGLGSFVLSVVRCRFRKNLIGLSPFYGLYNSILSVVTVMTLPLSAVATLKYQCHHIRITVKWFVFNQLRHGGVNAMWVGSGGLFSVW